MSVDGPHEIEWHHAGTYHGWSCSCGAGSRHLLPLYRTIRNATAHKRKAERSEPTKQVSKQSSTL